MSHVVGIAPAVAVSPGGDDARDTGAALPLAPPPASEHRTDGLHAATAENANLAAAVRHYGEALTAMRGCSDEFQAAQHLARVALAADAVSAAADAVSRAARAGLAAWFDETGCPALRTETHTVSLTQPKPAPRVIDASAVPDAFMAPQPPKPDMDAIKAAIGRGETVPGVALSNGAPFVSFRQRSKS